MTENEPTFDKSNNTGFRHLFNAIRWSIQGLVAAFKREAAFRQELAIIILLLPLGVWIARSLLEFAILLGACLFVLAAELFNSSLEAAIDRISEEQHPLSGLAKDYGSAAVMMCMAIALLIWVAMLVQRLT